MEITSELLQRLEKAEAELSLIKQELTTKKTLIESVFTFEVVLEKLEYRNDGVLTLNMWKNVFSPYEVMCLIYKCFNEGWEPDWTNPKEKKHYPWFTCDKQSFALNRTACSYGYTPVSSQLCSHSEDVVRHICKYFLKEYNEYLKYILFI